MSNLYGGLTTPHWNQIDKIHYGPASTLEPETDGIMLGRYVLVKYQENEVLSQEYKNKIIAGALTNDDWKGKYSSDGNVDYDGVVFIKQFIDNSLKYIPVARLSTTVTDDSFTAIQTSIGTLIDKDTGKSVRDIASEEVAKIVAEAPDTFDTLEEIAEWINNDKSGAVAMSKAITQNTNNISTEITDRTSADVALQESINNILGQLTLETFNP